MSIPKAELAWAAGLFEGEGSVRINVATVRNLGHLLVDVPNTDAEIVAFFHARWGGTITSYAPTGNRRGYFRWRASSRMAATFLNDVLPYLRTLRYRERALLGLEYQAQKIIGRGAQTDDYHARQQDYYSRMASLNLRGARTPSGSGARAASAARPTTRRTAWK